MTSALQLMPLEHLDYRDSSLVRVWGAKAMRLAHLQGLGLQVPPAMVLSVPVGTHVGDAGTAEVDAILAWFAKRHPHGSLCLRSSASSEDGATHSEAGQWFSWFSVPQDRVRLHTAIHDYLALLQRTHRGRDSQSVSLTCLIQAEVACSISGVCFSRHPDPAFGPHPLVQYTDGHGSHFTDGRRVASTVLISRFSSRAIVHRQQTATRAPDHLLRQLASISDDLEHQFGGPQDIEFGWSDGHPWVFQTRPVTALLACSDDHLWTRAAADEFWSGTVSDTMWSTVGDCIENQMLRRPLGALPDEHLWQLPLLKAHQGYVYLNTAPVRRVIDALPGWAGVDALQSMVGRPPQWRLRPVAPLSFWRIVAAFLRAGFRWLPWMPFPDLERSTAEGRKLYVAVRSDPQSVNREQVLAALEDHLANAVWGMIWAYVLVQLSHRTVSWLTDGHDDASSVAFGANAHDPVFQLDRALRTAAGQALRDPDRALADIMEQYGHLAFGRDITQPRWHERPQTVASLLGSTRTKPVHPRSSAQALRELAAMARSCGGWQRVAATWLLAPVIVAGRAFVAWREAMRFGSDYYLAALRIVLREPVAETTPDHEVPMWLRGVEPTSAPVRGPQRPDHGTRLYGSSLYRGVAEATAFVLREPSDVPRIPAGAILVCEYLDPSLGPILPSLAGAVFEFGGVLSHGGILCREHRIPSLCSVPQATRRVRSGQRVRVNAIEGWIELLP